MKIVGMRQPAAARPSWTSKPVWAPSWTSSTKQRACVSDAVLKNSSAEQNAPTLKPAERRRNCNARRNDTSSSTIETIPTSLTGVLYEARPCADNRTFDVRRPYAERSTPLYASAGPGRRRARSRRRRRTEVLAGCGMDRNRDAAQSAPPRDFRAVGAPGREVVGVLEH